MESIRRNMIDQQLGWSPRKIDVRVHSDSIRRVTSRTNSYYYAPVNGTPYSLAIVLPEPYGHYRVEGQIEVMRREENYTQYFAGKDWRVHPDWLYCENPMATSGLTGSYAESPEETIRAFLEQPSSNLRWRNPSNRPTAFEQWSCESSEPSFTFLLLLYSPFETMIVLFFVLWREFRSSLLSG